MPGPSEPPRSGPLVPVPTGAEVLASLLLGQDTHPRRLPPPPPDGVVGALERAVLPALERAPCMVSFSGGRDSSAILALAVSVARRHGLPDPIPVIMRFASAPEADELSWQRMVLQHLGLRHEEVLDLGDELDALGPYAVESLTRHGLRWPANGYMHLPIIELARGGSLVTGIGGDELLASQAGRRTVVLRRAARPRASDLPTLAVPLLPPPLARSLWRRRHQEEYARDYLTPRGRRALAAAFARETLEWPDRWDRAMHHWYSSRAFTAIEYGLSSLAAPHDVLVLHPLATAEVMAGLERDGGPLGFPSRTAAMARYFGDLLPRPVIDRHTKAHFAGAFWGPAFRGFAATWDGRGVDPELVDVSALRAQWRTASPDFRTALLLHQAWLAARERAVSR